ncbi:MAG: undecaprenyldiphospho-muramoylpentapeptide beta-N-acetylglucosaminyltransferase [Aquificaceae bacterium]
MRLFVSGGGTGGHFFPALALIECLLEKGLNTVFVGSERGIEYKLRDKILTESLFVPAYPFMGRSPREKLLALLKSFQGACKVAKFINKKDIGIVFGGYASLPLGLASIIKGVSLYLHEQNSIPSKSNRLLSKFAKKVFITFEYSKKFFPSYKTIKTGLPVRRSLIKGVNLKREEALKALGLEDNKPTLLVMGGSQGASFLNELAKDIFVKTGWQGIHISGDKDYQNLKNFYKERGLKVLLFSFSHDMHLVYRASTVALSRSGASSITELSLYGIPSLFIPFPHAIQDHQFYNAKEIEDMGGALTLRQEEAQLDKVLRFLQKLMGNHAYYSKNISSFANPLACEEIANYLLS